MVNNRTKIAVIGAGISGLTLASLLKKEGYTVDIYESSDSAGGAIKTTISKDGWMAEWGPNTIIESSARIKKLVALAGLESERIYPTEKAKKRYIVRNHKPVPAPASLLDFLRTPLLSKRAKWRVLKEPFIKAPLVEKAHIETVADFVRRRLGEEFLNWPVDALVGGIYAGDPEQLSVYHAFPRLSLLEQQHGSLILGQLKGGLRRPPESDEIPRNKASIFSFKRGLQTLPDALANQLGKSIYFNSRLKEIRFHQGEKQKWSIITTHCKDFKHYDAIVYAGNTWNLDQITFPASFKKPIKTLHSITHPPVSSVTLGFKKTDVTHSLDGFGVLVPGIEQLPILGTLFTSSIFPGRSPDTNTVTLTTYLGGMRQPEIALKSESEQIELVIKALSLILGVRGSPLCDYVIHHKHAIPQYHVGFDRILEAMETIEQTHRGMYLCGNFKTGISVGDSINAAFDLAARISIDIPLYNHQIK